MNRFNLIQVFAVAALFSNGASAHVVLENQVAQAGSYYKAVLKVSHGCDGSPIKKIILTIPDGFQGAKPMIKPGWNIEIKKEVLKKPYVSHGKTISQDVIEITWDGNTIPNGFYDEFVVVGKLPETEGKIYWKTTQICEKGQIDWNQIPVKNQSLKDLEYPAAELKLISPDQSSHQHNH